MPKQYAKSWNARSPQGGGRASPWLGQRFRPPLRYLGHNPQRAVTQSNYKSSNWQSGDVGKWQERRVFVDVAILRLIPNPAVLRETMLIGLFGAPGVHETAPSNGRHSINQRSQMLGPLLPNCLALLVARSDFERLEFITEVGFPIFDSWPTLLGGWLGTFRIRAALRAPHRGALAGFHLHRALASVRVTVTLSSLTCTSWELCNDVAAISRSTSTV